MANDEDVSGSDLQDEFESRFSEINAGDVYEHFMLRNPEQLREAFEQFDGDEEILHELFRERVAAEDWAPWSELDGSIDEETEEIFIRHLGHDLAYDILYQDTIDVTHLEEIRAEQEDETVTTEALIHAVKEMPHTHTTFWECSQCGDELKTTSRLPYRQPSKPRSCPCGASAKKYFSYAGAKRRHGFLFKVTSPNKLPSQDARIANVWVALDDIDIQNGDAEEEDKITRILEGYGAEIEIEGTVHFKVDTSRGEVKNTELWLLAGDIEKSESELERVNFTEADREALQEVHAQYDDERQFFDDHLAPGFIGREGLKRAIAYTMATPLVMDQKDGKVMDYGVGRLMIVGDPGTAKSKTTNAFLKSTLADLGAEKISAEYLSHAGLGGTVSKSKDGFWEIDWGLLPYVHETGLVLDGMHNFSKEWFSQLREIIEECVIKIIKAAKGEAKCATRIVGIANTNLYPISEHYPTNYQASFDIGIGGDDDSNKLAGADRRRWDLVWVTNEEDVDTSKIDSHLLKSLSEDRDEVDTRLWEKLWAWIWSLEYDDYDWDAVDALEGKITKKLNEWRNEYPNAELAVLGNKAGRIIPAYLLASAALHARVNEDGEVSPTEDDLDNVVSLFEDMFEKLELEKYERMRRMKNTVAKAVYSAIESKIRENQGEDGTSQTKRKQFTELKKILIELGNDPTQSVADIAEEVGVSRKTVYSRWGMEITLELENHTIEEYTPIDGYRDGIIDIEPLVSNTRLTTLGKSVLNLIRKNEDVAKVQPEPQDDDGDGQSSNRAESGDEGGGSSTVEEDESQADDDNSADASALNAVRIIESVPEFTGVDVEAYGPYSEGEIVAMPKKNADVLIDRDAAEEVYTNQDKVMAVVKLLDERSDGAGADINDVVEQVPLNDETVEDLVQQMIRDGELYEPSEAGRVAVL